MAGYVMGLRRVYPLWAWREWVLEAILENRAFVVQVRHDWVHEDCSKPFDCGAILVDGEG